MQTVLPFINTEKVFICLSDDRKKICNAIVGAPTPIDGQEKLPYLGELGWRDAEEWVVVHASCRFNGCHGGAAAGIARARLLL